MKHKLLLAAIFVSALITGSHAVAAEKLTVAATPIPHAEILKHIKPVLKKEGINLQIKVFTDYVQPDVQVAEGHIDANYFQHKPYMDTFNEEHDTHLVSVGQVHVEPFGAYSKKIDSVDALKDGATVAIPNDPSNAARALLLMQHEGLIKLKDPNNLLATSRDIIKNPKHLKFKEIEAATLPRILPDVDMAMINTNYALEAGLDPTNDALFIEDKDSPYANIVAVRKGHEDDPVIKKLMKALQSKDVKQFIEKKYKGAIVPAF